ncbi:hypothetical protein B0H14DRAFT_2610946 [Mycena olivaceomarginata]|nr:hypothetical protein B0H14DRAFT_2610946 [Mycena olivaceomarginata]
MQIQDNLLHHHSLIVQRSIAQNLHHFETAVPFPRILLLHQTVTEAGIQPDSHIYVRFPLLGGAGSNSTPVEVDNGASPRQASTRHTRQPPKTITPIMSHSRDNPDPRLIVNGPRQRKQAPMLSDPNNDETEIAAMEAFVEQIDTLTRKLPSSIPIAAREGHISRSLTLPGQDGDAASTWGLFVMMGTPRHNMSFLYNDVAGVAVGVIITHVGRKRELNAHGVTTIPMW